jgi:hypothetical protein
MTISIPDNILTEAGLTEREAIPAARAPGHRALARPSLRSSTSWN